MRAKILWLMETGYVWNNKGDEAILYDQNGNVVDTYKYGRE